MKKRPGEKSPGRFLLRLFFERSVRPAIFGDMREENGMTVKQSAGVFLTIVFALGFLAWNIWLSNQPDANLLVRAFGAGPLAAGAFLSWRFLVRRRKG